ncbi:uncharacterized protein FOBCDRAFT_262806 [Fusarium oxysporum Fo47]|uniref:uncharacterized protein n=1 Tax=Fusarium oxysporum Fo47 TaxID=660027 RepID=UPI002869BF3D|nr:uncharacterized protein FOBCDRAFT_262806 [Fusarium oxysporum Fo47]WJG35895.1 hypothetical protein FOBCDRAFT_262806 [Fusarium oxysporum Fo47]
MSSKGSSLNSASVRSSKKRTKRSKIACLRCRHRKVRCDVADAQQTTRSFFPITASCSPDSQDDVLQASSRDGHVEDRPSTSQFVTSTASNTRAENSFLRTRTDIDGNMDSLHDHLVEMFSEMNRLESQDLPSSTLIVLLVQSMAIHQLRMESADSMVRKESLQAFTKVKGALRQKRDSYAAHGYSTGYLDRILRQASIIDGGKTGNYKELNSHSSRDDGELSPSDGENKVDLEREIYQGLEETVFWMFGGSEYKHADDKDQH